MTDPKVTINVGNMNCGHCSGMVQKTLESIQGISEILVDLEGKKAVFSAQDEGLINTAVEAITKAGYPASTS